jgi:hypothetical protein
MAFMVISGSGQALLKGLCVIVKVNSLTVLQSGICKASMFEQARHLKDTPIAAGWWSHEFMCAKLREAL